jgi:cell wall-associated NlpC family hydrolase
MEMPKFASFVSILGLAGGILAAAPGASAAVPAPTRTDIVPGCGVLQPGASPVAQQAVRAACSQIGHYDGHDPASKNDGQRLGFDCSGLTRYAYYRATGRDILNGTSDNQFHTRIAVARFSPGQGAGPLLPGDLLFWGRGHIHHVAIYLGAGRMVEAFQSGTHVRAVPVRLGGDYAGAVRVA